ncbi:MAG: UDP-N-acetylmuramate--L-alanine ligase [Candidatus Saccharimonadales bacterium]
MLFAYSKVYHNGMAAKHIYFSGIGGTAIGPLALIAQQAGFDVSGSDKQDSQYIHYLKSHGIRNIHIGQDNHQIAALHATHPIDWFVYSSAVAIENPDAPELRFCTEHGIKVTKRDELLNHIINEKNLKLIAIAGTHGKTTTTAMLIWLLKQCGQPVSYSVGAKISFGEMGEYTGESEYFVYEADEFDRNFLAFSPFVSVITGIDWDHPDIYPTRLDYEIAFKEFLGSSKSSVLWREDAVKLDIAATAETLLLDKLDSGIAKLTLAGLVNRQNAWEVAQVAHAYLGIPLHQAIDHLNRFPGVSRRFEALIPGLYSDYAHTPPKISGALQLAHEVAGDKVVVVYEGLHNTRQHFIKDELMHLFDSVKQLYVVPSYLAREDQSLSLLTPSELIQLLSPDAQTHAEASDLDDTLLHSVQTHLADGDLVLCLTAGGGGSLDEWLRHHFVSDSTDA